MHLSHLSKMSLDITQEYRKTVCYAWWRDWNIEYEVSQYTKENKWFYLQFLFEHIISSLHQENTVWEAKTRLPIYTSSAHPSNSLTLFWKKISVSMISERILKKDIIDVISSSRIFDILSLSMLKEAENSLVFIKIYRS